MSGEWSQIDEKALRVEDYLQMFANLIRTEIENEHLPEDRTKYKEDVLSDLKEDIVKDKSDKYEWALIMLLEELYFVCKEYNWYRSGDSGFDSFIREFDDFRKKPLIRRIFSPTESLIANKREQEEYEKEV